jgi:hypothetical protein
VHSQRDGVVEGVAADLGSEAFGGPDVDADAENVLGITCEREEIERARASVELDEKIDVAAGGVLAARDRTEETYVTGVSTLGRVEDLCSMSNDELA